jgi:hypothetical protein
MHHRCSIPTVGSTFKVVVDGRLTQPDVKVIAAPSSKACSDTLPLHARLLTHARLRTQARLA